LTVVLLAGACQSTGSSGTVTPPTEAAGSTTVGTAPNGTVVASPTTNPLDVVARVDDEARVSRVIGVDGGELVLGLADGTEVTLEVPPGAVPWDTRIRMTAVDALDGWDFAPTGLAAVQLAPDGLELLVPASLTFRRPGAETAGETGQIAWAGQGTDLHPIPGAAVKDGSTFPVDHFSGYGHVWNLSMGYWGEWEQYAAREWAAYLEQNLAELLRIDQQKQMLGVETEGDLVDLVVGSLDEWYVRVYLTLMSAADTSCENARAAALAQLTLAQQLQVIGVDIGEAWQGFHDKWTKKGVALPYTFDGFPFDFVSRLVETCDREALDACLASGDLGLLLMYVRDRTSILDLSAQPVSGVGDGSALIDRCARFGVELDFVYAVDRTVDQIDHPLFREAERWGLKLRVDLRWKQFGADPWVGRVIGEAVPVWTGLGAQYRSFATSQNDQGVVTGTWQPWCPVAYAIGPWKPWPVRLHTLDFNRERVQRVVPPLLFWPGAPGGAPPEWGVWLGPRDPERLVEFDYDSRLVTTSFKSAEVFFESLPGTDETVSWCSGGQTDADADRIFAFLLAARPADTKWTWDNGLFLGLMGLPEEGSHPVIASRTWPFGRRSVSEPATALSGGETSILEWEGAVVLTHTALSE
jgi:hypothetical protein